MRYTRYIVAFVALILAAACTISDIDDTPINVVGSKGSLQVVGRVTQYTDCDVATRSKKEGDEPKVTSMGLALFPIENGTIGNCVYYDFQLGGSIVFIVDRHDAVFNNYEDKPFAMYIFANMQEAVDFPQTSGDGVGKSLEYFTKCASAANVNVKDVPENGFPMIGSLGNTLNIEGIISDGVELILKPKADGDNVDGLPLVGGKPTDNLEIPLKAMYAKFTFTISSKPDQEIVGNKAPRFDLVGYTVHNIPATVDGDPESNDDANVYPSSDEYSGGGKYAQGATTATFDFYLPERYLTPTVTDLNEVLPDELKKGTYDTTVDADQDGYRDEDEKYHQRFKNKLVEGQNATYITIEGKYTDHQGHLYDVSYNIYVGGNNTDNFDVIRNTHYINSVAIRGISTSSDMAENKTGIAIDWRVEVDREATPLVISFRREALLDAHYEVRPLRLRLVGENILTGTSATVQVLNQDGTSNEIPNWIRLEKSSNTGDHITSGVSAGKRKYFTADLVTKTLAGGTSVTVDNLTQYNQAVWIYVDENTDTKSRAAIVRVSHGGINKDYKIVQQGLYEVTGRDSGKTYYIEQYEEYLYNYDAEDSYGQTKEEGMPWGLDGVQLSKEHFSYDSARTPNVDWAKYETKGPRPYYDFYTWQQDSVVLTKAGIAKTDERSHNIDNAGQHFTEEIYDATKNNADDDRKVKVLTMAQQPSGAVEYCYNRNKRDANGNVEKVEWYLPSADELEEFIVPAYASFKEFQDNYYWTSQPAYIRNIFYYEYQSGRFSSKTVTSVIVYDDNPKYARASKVARKDGAFEPVPSGLNFEPTPSVDRTPSGYTNLGYFDKMHYYKHYYESIISGLTEVYGIDKNKDENVTKDEQYTHNGSYFAHLNIPVETLITKTTDGQYGYHERTRNNRVRCVRKMD